MRKTRKVIADVTASPPVPPPSPQSTKAKTPPCIHCRKGPAKELLVLGQQTLFPAFCSPSCAVDFALACVHTAYIERCQAHQQWRNSLGRCPDCEERWAQAKNLGNVQPAAAQAVEGEVSNDQ